MRTNIEIDDQLIEQAMHRTGARTKRAVVEAGLKLLVQMHGQKELRKLRGKIQWQGDLNRARLDQLPAVDE